MSNTLIRIIVALVGIPIIVLFCILGSFWLWSFVAILCILGLREFYDLMKAKGALPLTPDGIVASVIIIFIFEHERITKWYASLDPPNPLHLQWPSMLQALFIFFILFILWILLRELFRNKGSAILNIATTLFGVLYIGLFLGTFVGIRELFGSEFPTFRFFSLEGIFIPPNVQCIIDRWGGLTLISICAIIWVCDSAAYFGGRAMGKHKLFERVSPKKSWEGAVWGFIGALATAVAAKYLFLSYLTLGESVVMGAIIGLFGQLGDLVESLLKRDVEIKDSSRLIPGHGGILDRFDSLLFVSPILYLYLDFVVFHI